jgi:hypothetical protein
MFADVARNRHTAVSLSFHFQYTSSVRQIEQVRPSRHPQGAVVLRFSARQYADDGHGRVDLRSVLDETPIVRDIGELRVAYSLDGIPVSVELKLEDGVTATELQRFPWARWLRVADAYNRRADDEPGPHPAGFHPDRDADTSRGTATTALAEEAGRKISAGKRPGRRGHPDQHYRDIAARYDQLVAGGTRNPTACLAEQLNYSRNTVAGWVSTARKRGYLPPARPGRAG